MTMHTVSAILWKQKQTILLVALFVAAVSFFTYTILAPRYESTTDFQIVQMGNTGQDFYTLFKTSEYLGKVFGEAIESERFIQAVIESGSLKAENLPVDPNDRLTLWRDEISFEKNVELGMFRVIVKNDSQREADRISKGIATVLIEKNSLFRGGEEKSVEVRVLSGPLSERNPNFAEIAIFVGVMFVVGLLLASAFILARHGVLFRRDTHTVFTIPRDMFRRPMA